MPQCAFKNCVNNHRNTKISEGISFFRFPSDPFLCSKWVSIVAIEREEEFYQPCENSKICSIHFEPSDITGNTQRRRLSKTSIPKLQIHESTKLIVNKSTSTSSNPPSCMDLTETRGMLNTTLGTDAVSYKPPSASVSDLISLCGTPRHLQQLTKLTQKLSKFRKIIQDKSQKIKNLQKVNKRLAKKNLSLKNIINLLLKAH